MGFIGIIGFIGIPLAFSLLVPSYGMSEAERNNLLFNVVCLSALLPIGIIGYSWFDLFSQRDQLVEVIKGTLMVE